MKKVIIITGASAGIGKATALQLINEGHIVYGAARRTGNMQDIADAGGHIIELDVTNHEQVTASVQQIWKNRGALTCWSTMRAMPSGDRLKTPPTKRPKGNMK